MTLQGNRFRLRHVLPAAAQIAAIAMLVAAPLTILGGEYQSGIKWAEPKVVDSGTAPGGAPGDAIVLFDGKDLSKWEGGKWIVKDGCAVSHETDLKTKQGFGDCQLHLEWATPEKVEGSGQGRGNSGVFLMSNYELQILDSYQNETYFDGQAGAIYKQHPPLMNACRKPGEWQSYDVVFTAPRFDKDGKVQKPAYITVLQNGVLIQSHFEIKGQTAWDAAPAYHAHAEKMPIVLQFHGNPVKFRNIWIRELQNVELDAGKAK
jgi:hypothetical protein